MKNILIIDDNAMNLNIAKEILENAGYQSMEAEDALTGIQLMKKHRPDLVLLDLLMPQVDGFEAIQRIKTDSTIQDIPLIAFTALASNTNREKALDYGCVDIITKPIDIQQFLYTINSYSSQNSLPVNALENSQTLHSQTVIKQPSQEPNYTILVQQHTILVVDDNPINADLLKEALESLNQSVLIASNGEDALRIAQLYKPSLILLDIMMPGMNGYVLLEHLKNDLNTKDIPVLIISALDRTEDRIKGLLQGATDYICKPFEFEELKVRISCVLRNKDLQDELKLQRDNLIALNKELAEFTTIASHDLQAPLRKIRLFIDQLQMSRKSSFSEEDADILQRIHTSAAKMHTLVQDLLNLSRAGYRGRELKSVDLEKVAHEAVLDLQEMINKLQAQVIIGNLPIIKADEVQIRQLISNLLSNAIKFNREGVISKVTVSSKKVDSLYIQLIVEDNGIGFDEAMSARIFNAFERVHGDTKYSGSGIGLAICKKVAERHGGSIESKSHLGEGSVFTVTLPY